MLLGNVIVHQGIFGQRVIVPQSLDSVMLIHHISVYIAALLVPRFGEAVCLRDTSHDIVLAYACHSRSISNLFRNKLMHNARTNMEARQTENVNFLP